MTYLESFTPDLTRAECLSILSEYVRTPSNIHLTDPRQTPSPTTAVTQEDLAKRQRQAEREAQAFIESQGLSDEIDTEIAQVLLAHLAKKHQR